MQICNNLKAIIFFTLLSGVTSTLSMDVVNRLTSIINVTPPLNINFIGNLLSQWLQGDFVFSHPGEVTVSKYGLLAGYLFHYFAGVALAFPYCWLFLKVRFFTHLSILKSALYGLICSSITLLVIYPSVGLGLCGLKNGSYELLTAALINHFVYGLALLASCNVINRIQGNTTH
ncbi:DUF2938 family protein [Pantoea sp. RHCKP32]|uniref:DUF2938 family protein n=1 Tax=Pantoea sp. RHCKP32 TaxID=3425182 RepID=UPI003DA14807